MKFIRPKKKVQFDIATLKKNDIVILTLDERWNKLFTIIPISREILKRQNYLNKLLGQEATLYQEQQNVEPEKKKQIHYIITLTQEVFEKNNEEAKRSLEKSKNRIEELNRRAEVLGNDLFLMKGKIREANFRLLEGTVQYTYGVMAESKKKEKKIENELEQLKIRLRDLQAQRQNLAADWTEVYTFFHALLGPEELSKLDLIFFKPEVEKNEIGGSEPNETGR